jgi:polysaccharide deacetylase 2 family uncharacterized protein YibQ
MIYNNSKKTPDAAAVAVAIEQPPAAPVAEITVQETPVINTPPVVSVPPVPDTVKPPPAPVENTANSAPIASAPNSGTTITSGITTRTTNMGSVAFVIDDAGNNLTELDPFLRIPGQITIAVLPGLPYSAEAARRIRAAGKEVLLHQPMEAVGGQNPGPGAIYSNMNADQIRSILKKNLEEVGPVVGMNNHQGSKITTNQQMMEVILAFCSENNIFFLDSRTSVETAAPAAARRLGMKIAERDVFLDNEQDKESMQRFLTSGLARAQRNGTAIMIGHTWSPALAPLLAEHYPRLIIEGYSIKTVGEILK